MEYLKNDKKMFKYWTETLDRNYCLNYLYPKIGDYLRNKKSRINILDIGLREYNKYCKYYFNLKNINYDIIDIENKKEILNQINYDNFYHYSICDKELTLKNKNKYDCILSFGVLGFYYFSNYNINIYLKNINLLLKDDGIFILKLDYLSKYKNNSKKAKVNQELIDYWGLENFKDILNKYFQKTNINKINKNIYINDNDYYNFQCYKYKEVKKILVIFNNCKSMQNIVDIIIQLNKIYEVYFYFNHQTSINIYKWNELFTSEENDIRITIKKKLLKNSLNYVGSKEKNISYDEQFKDAIKYNLCIMDDSNGVWKGDSHGYNFIYQSIKKYNPKIKVIGNIEGLKDFNCKKINKLNEFENLPDTELESVCKSYKICYDYIFIWDKYQYNYVKKYVKEEFIRKIGLPYMDKLQKYKNNNLKKYIILFPSKTPNLVKTKWRAFDNYIIDLIKNYSSKLNCTLVIKEKPSKELYYEKYKSKNIIVNQVEGDELDYFISNSKIIFGAPSTVLIRGLMLNIPTIIFDDNYYGQKGFLENFHGLIKKININVIEKKYNFFIKNKNYIDKYMKNNFYGFNFQSSDNFIYNIKKILIKKIDNEKKNINDDKNQDINMKWNLGFLKKNSFHKKIQINEISNFYVNDENIDKSFGIADPFIYKDYIFCELIDNSLKGLKINSPTGQNHKGGVIACAKIDKKLNFKIILKNKNFHYSYPHIFEINNILYMMPETHQSNQLQLYECTNFPYDWNLKKVLIDNFCCCDSTYFNLDGMHYIFTQKYVRNKVKESKTYLYKTNNLLNSKLIIDKEDILKSGYRGGGNIIKKDNKIYIPIQPNEINFYGEKLYIYEIEKRNNQINFIFQNEIIKPTNIIGCHHISNYNKVFIIDYIKKIKQ